MWLITNFGFFSLVEKPDDKKAGTLTIRARAKADLIALRDRYLPEMGEVQTDAGTDYKYRARATRNAIANAAARAVFDIDYSNFKNSVAEQQGSDRAHVYSDVWNVLFKLQETAPQPSTDHPQLNEKAIPNRSYGGILIDSEGRVLLREPAGHFDGYFWTFPKGRPDKGESPVNAALREVLEETGYRAKIVCRIPAEFRGGTGDNVYFIMRPRENQVEFDKHETTSIRWATPNEARTLIAMTTNPKGRKRDIDVLEAALNAVAGEEKGPVHSHD